LDSVFLRGFDQVSYKIAPYWSGVDCECFVISQSI
jgi:hypothetical protein